MNRVFVPRSTISGIQRDFIGYTQWIWILVGCVLMCCVQSLTVFGQEKSNALHLNAFGGWSLFQHTAGFRALPGVPNSSPGFTEGVGSGFFVGAGGQLPLFSHAFVALRGGYAQHNALLQASEPATVSVNGTPLSAVFRHQFESRLDAIFLEPLFGYRLPEPIDFLRVMLGMRAEWMTAPTFTQTEILDEPTGAAAFSNGSKMRNVRRNEALPNGQALQLGLVSALGIDIPLTPQKSILLSPEVSFTYPLTPFVQGIAWQAQSLKFALGFTYTPSAVEQSVIVPQQSIRLSVQALSVDNQGNERGLIRIKTEEYISRQLYPLLEYIFFEPQSAVLPARYSRLLPVATRFFSEQQFAGLGTLDVYYNILNVLGKRLRDNSTATIRLVGCLGEIGFGPNSEENDPTLSLRRAEAVRQYLSDVWGIAEGRKQVEGRKLPEKPSNARNATIGAEENRRVEIVSNSWEIMKPVVVADTLRETDPPSVKFFMTAEPDSGIIKWSLRAFQNNRTLKTVGALGKPDETYLWQMSRERLSVPSSAEPLSYELTVLDSNEQESSVENTIKIEQITIRKKRQNKVRDKEVDFYRLIGFSFEQSRLTGYHLQSFTELVQPNIKPQSVAEVIGYTDASGDPASNQRLSESRAQVVGQILATKNVKTRGVGGKIPIYPNTTPEGRFYSRTVEIRVETPVQE